LTIAPERLIFLDESGVMVGMTRRRGRCLGGRRIHEATPESHWRILTVIGAMSLKGMIATMTIEAATDTDIFLAYLDHVLCPVLAPGDVVVMDNLSSHKVQGVSKRIQSRGAELLYLPPYSPDLNPIEKAWSKLKQMLRTAKEPLRRCVISQRSRRRRNISSFSIKIKSKTTRNSVFLVVDLVSGGRFPASRDTTPLEGPSDCGVGRD
jgi:transposase